MSQYFPSYKSFGESLKVSLNLSNYATKTDLKNITHIDVSSSASKENLASLKTEVDKIDADKLKTVPADLAKLSNVVKNDVVKKTEYNKLVTKVDNTDTKGFFLKTKYDAENSKIDTILKQGSCVGSKDDLDAVKNKIPNVNGFLLTTVFNSKITEVENKIPNVSGLASKSELTAVENKIPDVSSLASKSELTTVQNKIPDVSNLVTKTNYNTKISEI